MHDRQVIIDRPEVAGAATAPISREAGRVACCLGSARATELGGNLEMEIRAAREARRLEQLKHDRAARV